MSDGYIYSVSAAFTTEEALTKEEQEKVKATVERALAKIGHTADATIYVDDPEDE